MFNFLLKTNFSFDGKREGEEVLICLHRHWFILLGKALMVALLTILPIIFFNLIEKILLLARTPGLIYILLVIYYMIIWSSASYALTMYLLDSFIVTNKRILISIQKGFFNRLVYETSIDRVQDIKTEINGLIPTTLHFGNIDIKTASVNVELIFENISKPNEIKEKIMEIIHKNNPSRPI